MIQTVNGAVWYGGQNTHTGWAYATGDKLGFHFDVESGDLTVYKNGTKLGGHSGLNPQCRDMYLVISAAGSNAVTILPRSGFGLRLRDEKRKAQSS